MGAMVGIILDHVDKLVFGMVGKAPGHGHCFNKLLFRRIGEILANQFWHSLTIMHARGLEWIQSRIDGSVLIVGVAYRA